MLLKSKKNIIILLLVLGTALLAGCDNNKQDLNTYNQKQ
jgi:outer membrane murein-binding lipoprotein Lpp